MKTAYTDTNIQFVIENTTVSAPNIIFEQFTRTVPAHSHGNGCYEVHFIPYGFGKVKVNGVYHDITPNTLYVTGPHIEHAQTPQQTDPMQEYCVYFKLHSSARRSGKDGKGSSASACRTSAPIMDAFTRTPFWIGKDTQGIHDLMLHLFKELEEQHTGYRKEVELLLSQLIIALVRNYEQCKNVQTPVLRDELSDNKSRIIEEYFLYEYQSLSLKELASRLALSPRQTQRLLMEYYNKTFQEKKAEARMSVAAILLSDKTQSIAKIADALGYSSPEHFTNTFRNYYHVSPRTFRSQLANEPEPAPEANIHE